jgi:phosphoribosyl 1,2-cyclic phosphodiesterase
VGKFTIEAFPVIHSVHCPAVGYRITGGKTAIFYIPDVVFIREQRRALRGIDLYIGDGASIRRPLVRRRGETLFGHTTIRAQLTWCQREGVKRAIITHCGSEIVKGDTQEMTHRVRVMGRERGVEASIAHDGLRITL